MMLKLLEAQPKHVLYLQDFETFDTETTKEQEKPQSEVRRNLDFPSALGVRFGMDNVCIGGAGGDCLALPACAICLLSSAWKGSLWPTLTCAVRS
jgi:hypothetical protein